MKEGGENVKKFLYVVGLAFIILCISNNVSAASEAYYINSNGIEMTEEEYNNLVQLGFTEFQIEHMRQQVFEDNKDIEGELVSETKKYIKTSVTIRNGIKIVTQQEFPSLTAITNDMQLHAGQQPGFSPNTYGDYYDGLTIDTYRILTSKITSINDTYMRYKADIEYMNIPSVRSTDILAIGIESAKVVKSTSAYFEQNWITTNNNAGYNVYCAPKYEATGVSAVYELPTGSLSSLEATIYFNVTKINSNQTLSSVTAVGAHAHAIVPVNMNDVYDHYSSDIFDGIYIDTYYDDYFDSIITATALFIGSW